MVDSPYQKTSILMRVLLDRMVVTSATGNIGMGLSVLDYPPYPVLAFA